MIGNVNGGSASSASFSNLNLGESYTTTFNSDGSIKTVYLDGKQKITTFPSSSKIVETIKDADDNVLQTKTTLFKPNGDIVAEVTG